MKLKLLYSAFFIFIAPSIFAQFKYDNVLYHTVYLEDLPQALKNNPNALLLDVRSAGEFNDTSQYTGLNIGRLKGAKNINVRELGARITELNDHKNEPIFIYCSHSQRSRVSAKMLVDSGFTQVYNVNGAMTQFNLIKDNHPDLAALYETSNPFKLLSPRAVVQLLKSKNQPYIIDVRPDSVFNGISKNPEQNVQGRLKNAINIPLEKIKNSISSIPKNMDILITDSYGGDAVDAARTLSANGFTRLNVLFNGMDFWLTENDPKKRARFWIHPKDYDLISSEDFDKKVSKKSPPLILDIRTKAEYTNQEQKSTFRNRGHIANALNIPLAELNSRLSEIDLYKNKEVIVYAFSNSPEAYESAQILADHGYKKVKVLMGGLWNLRAKAANVKGLSHLMKLVVDVPEENL